MKKYLLTSPFAMWIVIVVGVVACFQLLGQFYIFPPTSYISGIGIVLICYWMYFFVKGISLNIQAAERPHHIKKLVTDGVYSVVRHPIYSGDMALAWGIFLINPVAPIFVSATWVTCVLLTWSYIEERMLTHYFGKEYTAYMHKVPLIIPGAHTAFRRRKSS